MTRLAIVALLVVACRQPAPVVPAQEPQSNIAYGDYPRSELLRVSADSELGLILVTGQGQSAVVELSHKEVRLRLANGFARVKTAPSTAGATTVTGSDDHRALVHRTAHLAAMWLAKSPRAFDLSVELEAGSSLDESDTAALTLGILASLLGTHIIPDVRIHARVNLSGQLLRAPAPDLAIQAAAGVRVLGLAPVQAPELSADAREHKVSATPMRDLSDAYRFMTRQEFPPLGAGSSPALKLPLKKAAASIYTALSESFASDYPSFLTALNRLPLRAPLLRRARQAEAHLAAAEKERQAEGNGVKALEYLEAAVRVARPLARAHNDLRALQKGKDSPSAKLSQSLAELREVQAELATRLVALPRSDLSSSFTRIYAAAHLVRAQLWLDLLGAGLAEFQAELTTLPPAPERLRAQYRDLTLRKLFALWQSASTSAGAQRLALLHLDAAGPSTLRAANAVALSDLSQLSVAPTAPPSPSGTWHEELERKLESPAGALSEYWNEAAAVLKTDLELRDTLWVFLAAPGKNGRAQEAILAFSRFRVAGGDSLVSCDIAFFRGSAELNPSLYNQAAFCSNQGALFSLQ